VGEGFGHLRAEEALLVEEAEGFELNESTNLSVRGIADKSGEGGGIGFGVSRILLIALNNVLWVETGIKSTVTDGRRKGFELSNALLHTRLNKAIPLFDNLTSIQSCGHDGGDYQALKTGGEEFGIDFGGSFEMSKWMFIRVVRVYPRVDIVFHEGTFGKICGVNFLVLEVVDRLSFGCPDRIIDHSTVDVRSLEKCLEFWHGIVGDTQRLLDIFWDRESPGNEFESMYLGSQSVDLVWSE
jgi:hypothetical protein